MTQKGYKQQIAHTEKIRTSLIGRKLSKDHKDNISNSLIGKVSNAKGKKWKIKDTSKMGKHSIGRKGYWFGKKMPEEMKLKMANSAKGIKRPVSEERKKELIEQALSAPHKAFERIDKEVLELEKKGFHCIPIGRIVPDIIAIKEGKIYAIEVEYGKPHYKKYDVNNYKDRFEDVIWLLRNR